MTQPGQFGFPLGKLLEGMTDSAVDSAIPVRGICADSRTVRPGDLFLACGGSRTHGGFFIEDAMRSGAAAVALEQTFAAGSEPGRSAVFPVPALREKLGVIASRFYGTPSARLRVVGVTGTNGKTSITWWLGKVYSLLTDRQAGMAGTLGSGRYPILEPGINTTPGAVALQRLFTDFVDAGLDTVFMEVSSHALDQGRVNGVDFDSAVFTNLSGEHLDYHADIQAYFEAKARLFAFPSVRAAVVNCDDSYGQELLRRLPAGVERIGYSATGAIASAAQAMVRAGPATRVEQKIHLDVISPWGKGQTLIEVTGGFNVSNLLAVIAVLCQAGFPLREVLEKMHGLAPAPGRMELQQRVDGACFVIDYAHTPAALQQALISLRPRCNGRLICVFGCGGERDKQKRPLMGALAEQFSDLVIVTDDNPREEPSDEIIAAILSGMEEPDAAVVEPSRARAIQLAFDGAEADDLVLIAGKGHEAFQQVGGVEYPFSDRQQIRRLLGGGG